MLDSFETGVIPIRWQKLFTETGQTLTLHTLSVSVFVCFYLFLFYFGVFWLVLCCCFGFFGFFFLNQSNKITAGMSDQLLIFFKVYADHNW